MLAVVPSLRAFAMSLTRNIDGADDLVQETLLRAIANIESFDPGTNMPGWLSTILRNVFLKGSEVWLLAPDIAALAAIAAVLVILATRSFRKRLA